MRYFLNVHTAQKCCLSFKSCDTNSPNLSNQHFPAICTIPSMEFVSSTDPASRVADNGAVLVTCESGYNYGNTGTKSITCSSAADNNNFPASCRREFCFNLSFRIVCFRVYDAFIESEDTEFHQLSV